MHELSICQSLIDLLSEQARVAGFDRVIRVRLEIGCFAGVEPQALMFGFDVSARGTVADGAALEIIDLPGKAWCFDCNETVAVETHGAECPLCSGARLRVTGGDELRVKDLEVI